GDTVYIRFLQWYAGLALLITCVPSLTARHSTDEFWQFNQALWLRLLQALLVSALVFLGLALGILAVENLFRVPFPAHALTALVAFTVFTFHFLSGIPRLRDVPSLSGAPKAGAVLTEMILLPLVGLYLLILYLYVANQLRLGVWPEGVMGYLVCGASALGIGTVVALHPLKKTEDRKWLGVYSRFIWWALAPLAVVLLIAAGVRIGEYSLTERRYL